MNENIVINTTTQLITETCCNCGVLFAMPKEMKDRFKREGGDFYCPNGHGQHYTEPTVLKLKHQLDQKDATIERLVNNLDGTQRRLSAAKGQITKIKNRVHNGVCPECHRHFTNLEEHMKHEHGTIEEKNKIIDSHK
jgi:peptidoglycan hydrolase CwlO-like protein